MSIHVGGFQNLRLEQKFGRGCDLNVLVADQRRIHLAAYVSFFPSWSISYQQLGLTRYPSGKYAVVDISDVPG
jgi:hypothetical protein